MMDQRTSLDDRVLVAMRRLARHRASATVREIMRLARRGRGEDSVAVLGAALRVQGRMRA
jgi:hypothetical protein